MRASATKPSLTWPHFLILAPLAGEARMGSRMGSVTGPAGAPEKWPQLGRGGLRRTCLPATPRSLGRGAGLLGETRTAREGSRKLGAASANPRAIFRIGGGLYGEALEQWTQLQSGGDAAHVRVKIRNRPIFADFLTLLHGSVVRRRGLDGVSGNGS